MWGRLSKRRARGDHIQPLSHTDIYHYTQLGREPLTPSDLVMLEAIDDAFLSQCSIEREGMRERQQEEAKTRDKPIKGRRR